MFQFTISLLAKDVSESLKIHAAFKARCEAEGIKPFATTSNHANGEFAFSINLNVRSMTEAVKAYRDLKARCEKEEITTPIVFNAPCVGDASQMVASAPSIAFRDNGDGPSIRAFCQRFNTHQFRCSSKMEAKFSLDATWPREQKAKRLLQLMKEGETDSKSPFYGQKVVRLTDPVRYLWTSELRKGQGASNGAFEMPTPTPMHDDGEEVF